MRDYGKYHHPKLNISAEVDIRQQQHSRNSAANQPDKDYLLVPNLIKTFCLCLGVDAYMINTQLATGLLTLPCHNTCELHDRKEWIGKSMKLQMGVLLKLFHLLSLHPGKEFGKDYLINLERLAPGSMSHQSAKSMGAFV